MKNAKTIAAIALLTLMCRGESTLTATDKAVYDALVTGYARNGVLLGRCAQPRGDDGHALSVKEIRELSAERPAYLEPVTKRIDWPYGLAPLAWSVIGSRERKEVDVPESAFEDYLERNQKEASLAGYAAPHVTVLRSRQPRSSTLSLSLPGYSFGRRAALVSVFCEPPVVQHGIMNDFCYLEKREGRRQLIAYRPMMIY